MKKGRCTRRAYRVKVAHTHLVLLRTTSMSTPTADRSFGTTENCGKCGSPLPPLTILLFASMPFCPRRPRTGGGGGAVFHPPLVCTTGMYVIYYSVHTIPTIVAGKNAGQSKNRCSGRGRQIAPSLTREIRACTATSYTRSITEHRHFGRSGLSMMGIISSLKRDRSTQDERGRWRAQTVRTG